MLLDEQFQQPGAGSLCSLYEKGLKTLTSQGGEGRRGKEERTRNQHKLERIRMIRTHTTASALTSYTMAPTSCDNPENLDSYSREGEKL